MKRISSTQRAYVHQHVIPDIDALFARNHIPESELREAALVLGITHMLPTPQLGLELTPIPDVDLKREASKRYSLGGRLEGNSDPDLFVVSEGRAY